jgi:hypothetical protein
VRATGPRAPGPDCGSPPRDSLTVKERVSSGPSTAGVRSITWAQ